jgi:hypothetical protein
MTYEVGDTRRPTLTIDPYDGNTVVVLTVTSPLGVVTTPALTGPVAAGSAGTWTAAASYTLTAPQRWTERWVATNAVTGVGAGAQSLEIDVEPAPPALGPGQSAGFATVAQYAAIIGGPLPSNLARLLRVASSTIRKEAGLASYDPTDATKIATLVEATCEQVKYALDNGWTNGTPSLTRQLSLGSASIGAPAAGGGSGGSGRLPDLSPVAYELLLSAGFIGSEPDEFAYWGWGA